MAVETLAQHERPHSQYIDFWNSSTGAEIHPLETHSCRWVDATQ
jgi:hypothetical protein